MCKGLRGSLGWQRDARGTACGPAMQASPWGMLRPSTSQAKASAQPSPWQVARPQNGSLHGSSALCSAISGQKAQRCPPVSENVTPQPHAWCPLSPVSFTQERELEEGGADRGGGRSGVHSPTISLSSRLMVSSAGRVVSCSGKS